MLERLITKIIDRITFTSFLVILTGFGFFLLLFLFLFISIPKDNLQLIETMLGVVGAAFTAIIGFKFGSSASSSKKDDAIINKL